MQIICLFCAHALASRKVAARIFASVTQSVQQPRDSVFQAITKIRTPLVKKKQPGSLLKTGRLRSCRHSNKGVMASKGKFARYAGACAGRAVGGVNAPLELGTLQAASTHETAITAEVFLGVSWRRCRSCLAEGVAMVSAGIENQPQRCIES